MSNGKWSERPKSWRRKMMTSMTDLYGEKTSEKAPNLTAERRLTEGGVKQLAIKEKVADRVDLSFKPGSEPKGIKKKRHNEEEQQQIMVASWLDKIQIPFYAIANGGSRHPLEAMKLRRMGVKPGVQDICIPVPRKGYHGLYVEMKRKKGGTMQDSQVYWRDLLLKLGYQAIVCRGYDDAVKQITDYFDNNFTIFE